jgi:hypothetical protein
VADAKKPEAPEGAPGDERKYVTIDDVKALLDKRDKQVAARFDTGFAELKEMLGKRAVEAESKPAEAAADKPAPVEESPAYRSLKRQLEETNARVKAAEDARLAEAAKATDLRLRQQLSESLTAAGVDPKGVRQAVMILVDGEKRVRIGEDGELVFRDGADEVDLATGLKGWMKSEDALRFLPPRGANGSGEKVTGKTPPKPGGAGQPSQEELAVKLQQALMGSAIGVG